MLIPALIYFMLFVYYPIFDLFRLSVFKYDMFKEPEFVGLANFKKTFTDANATSAFKNTFYYAVFTTIFIVGISFFVAIMIEQSRKLSNFYKIIYFIPYISPIVAVALIWQWIYSPGDAGLLNYALSFFHIPAQSWLQNKDLAMPSVIVVGIWRDIGYTSVIFIAGLKGIPREYYEAADVDGVNFWQRVRFITFPSLLPVFQFVLIITTMNTFKIFTPIYVLTQGGPVGRTKTIVYSIYEQAFQFSRWGYASSQAVVLFMLLMVLSFTQQRLTNTNR
jgi:ABC-type sugar transport system permease subunit